MSTRISSKRPSRRLASEAKANSSNGKRALNVDAYVETGSSHGSIRTQAPPPGILSTNRTVGQQTAANVPIDVEAIEDDVQLLSSSRGFPQGQNQSRRNCPVTVVLDEDSDVQAGLSGVSMLGPAVSVTTNSHTRQRHPCTRTVINCEVYENVEFGYKPKRKCVTNATESGNTAAPKEPAFTCAICWGQMVEETSTICGHIFCQRCIKAAIQAQKKCPTCRKALTMKNIHRVYLPTAN